MACPLFLELDRRWHSIMVCAWCHIRHCQTTGPLKADMRPFTMEARFRWETAILLSTVASVYRWMCCAQACPALQKLPFAFGVSSRPSSQGVAPLAIWPDLSHHLSCTLASHSLMFLMNSLKFPALLSPQAELLFSLLGDQLCWECRTHGHSSENICI